jgi:hypothetical protein
MKKILFIIVLVIISGVFCSLQAQTERIKAQETKTNKKVKLKGERIFIKYAEKCLDVMEQTAKDNSVKGVAIISFIPGDQTESWVSRMKVIGALSSPKANFLGIASAKASEMAMTLIDSGSKTRSPLNGELGYKGGAIRKVNGGYIVAAFSGGPSEIDYKISEAGLNLISEYY